MEKAFWYIGGVVVLAGVLWAAYYAISPIFINVRIDESAPPSSAASGQPLVEESVSEPAPKLRMAPVVGTVGHPASGTARLVEADGKTYLRYEDFKTLNGPDLYVYLATDMQAGEFVDLGRLRATEGNINYEVPLGTDVSRYRYALVWCKQFGVLFNYAELPLTP